MPLWLIVVLSALLTGSVAPAQTATPTPGQPAAFNPFVSFPSKKPIDKSTIPANRSNNRNSSVPQQPQGSGEIYKNPPPPQMLNTVPSDNSGRLRSSVPAKPPYSPPPPLPSGGMSFGNGARVEKAGSDLVIIDSGGRHIVHRAEFAGKHLKHWLDTHSTNSYKWRYGSLLWADHCL